MSQSFFSNPDSFFFEYINPACNIDVDIVHPHPGETDSTFKIYKNDQPAHHFALMAGQGLTRMINSERGEGSDVISQVLSLDTETLDSVVQFVQENGYLFPVFTAPGEYIEIPADTVKRILERVRSTVMLMSALGEIKKDYSKIIGLTLFLLFDDEIILERVPGEVCYRGCVHAFTKELGAVSMLPEIDGEVDANVRGYFSIPDTILPPSFQLSSQEYEDIMDGGYFANTYPGISDIRYHDIVYFYRNSLHSCKEVRTVADFVFHFMHEIGVIEKVRSDGAIIPYGELKWTAYSDKLAAATISAAKIVLEEEINSNLAGISPQYNIQAMEPAWKASSLLASMYFSIFYMKPGIEIYRKCANPNCSLSFMVKTTSSKRKYCSPECSNAMAQRYYRRRQKQKNALAAEEGQEQDITS